MVFRIMRFGDYFSLALEETDSLLEYLLNGVMKSAPAGIIGITSSLTNEEEAL
jgi:hypothetical protein